MQGCARQHERHFGDGCCQLTSGKHSVSRPPGGDYLAIRRRQALGENSRATQYSVLLAYGCTESASLRWRLKVAHLGGRLPSLK